MVSFAWEASFSVNIEQMDQQHRQIFAHFALIHKAMTENAGSDELDELLATFDSYTKMHFFDEERVMEDMEYPASTGHKRQHDLFVAQLDRIRAQDLSPPAPAAAIAALKEWFVNHILTEDMHYSEFFIRKYAG